MSEFTSSRNGLNSVDCTEAILNGLAPDGGLYCPLSFKQIDVSSLMDKSYSQIAEEILFSFFADLPKDQLSQAIQETYATRFDHPEVVPMYRTKDAYFMELWHGPTCAFKDVALTLMPHLLNLCMKKSDFPKDILILTATSGDTGKAALEAFKDMEHIHIKVLYPHGLVSMIQERQMQTTEGDNVEVLSVRGNFDDCQKIVKKIMEEKHAYRHICLSSANSINIGRLIPQVVYYFKAYADLLKQKEIQAGEQVDFIVPTGNFGDILAGYIAKEMSLPIGKLVCASNINNVLEDFINTGIYDSRRIFHNTIAPSIDILISSNLERLLYFLCKDGKQVASYMKQLKEKGSYQVDRDLLESIQKDFYGLSANENECMEAIRELYQKEQYLIDPHTATAYACLKKYRSSHKKVVLSTASPYKFAKAVYQSITGIALPDDLSCMDKLYELTGVPIPEPLSQLKTKEIRFQSILEKETAEETILKKLEELDHV